MSSQLQSPLVAFANESYLVDMQDLKIKECPFKSYFTIRGHSEDMVLQNQVRSFFNLNLPLIANAMVENNGDSVCWVGPDEWMLITDNNSLINKFNMFQGALANHFALVSDVSSAYTMINVEGSKAFEFLSKAMTYDIHPRVFKLGQCVSTTFAKAQAIVYPQGQSPHYSYKVIVRRSFADYVAHWIRDACIEYK